MIYATDKIPLRRKLGYFYVQIKYWFEGILNALGFYNNESSTPHIVKRKVIKSLAKKYYLQCFIETGTYWGDMLLAMEHHFNMLYSVELNEDLYQKAKLRFAAKPHIHLYHGDSSIVLPQILNLCNEKALFWLDAHYSGAGTARGLVDSPVTEELNCILRNDNPGHVVLIDDARCFDGDNYYPTIEEIRERVAARWSDYNFFVENDIIQIVPKRKG